MVGPTEGKNESRFIRGIRKGLISRVETQLSFYTNVDSNFVCF
jgi:hypothetical protein